jgi:hypothetical protein
VNSKQSKPPKAPVLRLVKPQPKADEDLIVTLASLLRRAQRGELDGFAYVLTTTACTYEADVSDRLRDSPIFARGLLCALQDRLK